MVEVLLKRRKHCGKEKLLVTKNFSFSHWVFKRLILQTCKNKGLFEKGALTASKITLMLTCPCGTGSAFES